MPALKQEGGRRPAPAAPASDPIGDFFKSVGDFVGQFNFGPPAVGNKPGQMASNQYLHDHGAGSILRKK